MAVWTEVRVPAGQERQDALIAGALAPLCAGWAADGGPATFLVRDQLDGAHWLRIWLRVDGADAPEVGALAAALRAVPTPTEDTPAGDTPVEVAVVAPSSFTPDDSPYGGPGITEFWHDFMCDATALMIEPVRAVAAGRTTRLAVAVDVMTAHLPAVDFARVFPERYPPAAAGFDLPVPFPALRSHADGFFMLSTDPFATRDEMDRRYAAAARPVERRVGAVLAQLAGSGPTVSPLADGWYRFARTYLERADRGLRSGRLTVEWDDGYITDGRDASVSPFHQAVAGHKAFQRFLRVDAGYQAMRVMMTSLYLGLNMVGLRLVDRFFLCHAVGRACESLFTVDVADLMREMADVFAATSSPPGVTIASAPGAGAGANQHDPGGGAARPSDLITPWALRAAAELRLAELIESGATGVADLAAAAGADPRSLRRLMRYLTCRGLFAEPTDGVYARTALTPEAPPPAPVPAGGDPLGARMMAAYTCLTDAVRLGEPAYAKVHGRPFWEDLAADPALARSFADLMAWHSAGLAPAVVAGYDWAGVRHVVDVGGGTGALLGEILRAQADLHGTLFDLPAVAAAAREVLAGAGVADRARIVGGSFFDRIPSGGDVYILSSVLHDWADADAEAIVRHCAEAAGRSGRILVVERLVGGDNGDNPLDDEGATAMDLGMLVVMGGRERTGAEFDAIAATAGLGRVSARPTPSGYWLLEYTPRHRYAPGHRGGAG